MSLPNFPVARFLSTKATADGIPATRVDGIGLRDSSPIGREDVRKPVKAVKPMSFQPTKSPAKLPRRGRTRGEVAGSVWMRAEHRSSPHMCVSLMTQLLVVA